MRSRLVLVLTAFLLLAYPLQAQELYRWVDENGVIHFTDNFLSIPEKYRDKVEKRSTAPAGESPTPGPRPGTESIPLTAPRQLFKIPFARAGNHMIVQGIVNRERTTQFILDTGASLTTISPALARQLGIDPNKGLLIPVRTASDVIVVSVVEIDSLSVGGAEVRNVDVTIQEIAGLEGRGLLGASFLSEFRVDINYGENQLILEHQPGPYGGHSARWWQQKFRSYSQYRKLYEDIRSGALNLAGSRFQELREKAAFLLQAVDTKINDLEIRASQAGVPRTLRE